MKHTRQTTFKITQPIAVLALVAFASSCKQENNSTVSNTNVSPVPTKTVEVKLPNTPETVVRTWEENVNKNKFALPRLISIGDALELVNSIAGDDTTNQADEVPTNILDVKCKENAEEAQCACTMQDDFGKRSFKYFLVKNNGQWLLSNIDDVAENDTTIGLNINEKPDANTK